MPLRDQSDTASAPAHVWGEWWRDGTGRWYTDYGLGLTPHNTNLGACNVIRGDGSIPQPACILPMGHGGNHYG